MIALFFITVVLFYWLSWYIKSLKIDRQLSSLPSLPSLPFLGSALLFIGDGEKIANSLIKIAELAYQHKGVIKAWLGPKLYVAVANPEDTQVILESCLDKGDVYRFMKPWLGNGVFLAPVNLWRSHRKVMLPVFNNKIIEQYMEIISEQSEMLVNRLDEKVDKPEFDVLYYITSCTLDIVYESSMGTRMDMQRVPDSPYIRARQAIMTIMNMRFFKLWLQPDCLFNLTPYAKMQENNIKITSQFTDECFFKVGLIGTKFLTAGLEEIGILLRDRTENNVVKMRRDEYEHKKSSPGNTETKSTNKIPSVLDYLFGREINFTNAELREHIDSITIAGTDATALTISYVLVLLGVFQDVQEKVYQEQKSIFGNNMNAKVTKEDLLQMSYLDRVIKEAMRVYPAIPIVARHIDKNLYLPHAGVTLPSDCEAVIGTLALHKSKDIWGPDVEDFDPDRFLPERFTKAQSASFIPFSHGSRNCIGRNLGLLLIKTILSRVCRAYKFDSNGIGPIKIEMLLFPVNGHQVQITKR